MNSKKYIVSIAALSVAGIMTLALSALAADKIGAEVKNGNHFGFGQLKNAPAQGFRQGFRQGQGIFGTVSAISGTTITVTAKQGPNATTTATYTVDATNAKITKNNAAGTISSISVGDTISVQGTISGTNVTATVINDGVMANRGQGIFGTVATVSGNTLTVTGKQGFGQNTDSTTFTVDASNAKITKDNAAGTIASILVGDTVSVQGTISGTNVVATTILDGVMPGRGLGNGIDKAKAPDNPAITGNGQPIVAGTISAISGNAVTITNKSNITYTIDATNAKITQGQNTITVAGLKSGDEVVVQGAVNGNSVVASSIIDQTKPASTTTTTTGTNNGNHFGFFGNLGQFFMHLFGF